MKCPDALRSLIESAANPTLARAFVSKYVGTPPPASADTPEKLLAFMESSINEKLVTVKASFKVKGIITHQVTVYETAEWIEKRLIPLSAAQTLQQHPEKASLLLGSCVGSPDMEIVKLCSDFAVDYPKDIREHTPFASTSITPIEIENSIETAMQAARKEQLPSSGGFATPSGRDDEVVTCQNCHEQISIDDSHTCTACGSTICRDCFYVCEHCEETICPECERTCDDCNRSFCPDCIELDSEDMLCERCHDDREVQRERQQRREDQH